MARLDDLPKLAASVGEGPALLVIGDVVARSTAVEAPPRARASRWPHDRAQPAETQDSRPGGRDRQPPARRRGGLSRGGRRLDDAAWSRRPSSRTRAAANELLAAAPRTAIRRRRRLTSRRSKSRATASSRAICANAFALAGPTFDLPVTFGILRTAMYHLRRF